MKFYIYTLGCKVNSYESNFIKENLEKEGYKYQENEADIYIINTCAVTNTAENKSQKMINHAIKNNPNALIIVCGCLSQIKEIKNANIVIGNKDKSKILEYIKNYQNEKITKIYDLNQEEFEPMILNNFDKTRAFVKIEDGCENFCSYCIIPYTRGRVRSKPQKEVIKEITNLIDNGHHEIVLTGIHTGHYNDNGITFSNLLEEISKLNGLERLRISSIEITELDTDFMRVLKNNSVIVDHIHIPLQSGCNKTLKSMNRKYDVEYFMNKIKELRSIRPNINITTDVIVGFPDETEADFLETIDTITKMAFTKIHVFPFSKKDGTKAATMEMQIPEVIKKERVKVLMELSKNLELKYMEKFIEQETDFICETKKDDTLIGHSSNYLLIKVCSNNENIKKIKIVGLQYPYLLAVDLEPKM